MTFIHQFSIVRQHRELFFSSVAERSAVLLLLLQPIVFAQQTSHFLIGVVEFRLEVSDGVLLRKRYSQIRVQELRERKKFIDSEFHRFPTYFQWIFRLQLLNFRQHLRQSIENSVFGQMHTEILLGLVDRLSKQWKHVETLTKLQYFGLFTLKLIPNFR